MRKIRYVFICSIYFFLTACSGNQTQANINAQIINVKLDESKSKFEQCFKNIENTKESIYVKQNIFISSDDANNKYQLLSSQKKLTEEEKNILLKNLAQRYECFRGGLSSLASIYTPYANVMSAYIQRNDVIYAKLINGTINIGEANQAVLSSKSQYAKEWDEARTIRNNQIAQAHNAELQDRNARTMILQNMLNSMMLPTSPTSITTCVPTANSINCMSR